MTLVNLQDGLSTRAMMMVGDKEAWFTMHLNGHDLSDQNRRKLLLILKVSQSGAPWSVLSSTTVTPSDLLEPLPPSHTSAMGKWFVKDFRDS